MVKYKIVGQELMLGRFALKYVVLGDDKILAYCFEEKDAELILRLLQEEEARKYTRSIP